MSFLSAKSISAGLASIAMSGSGVGIGVVFAGLIVATGRAPALSNDLFGLAVIGFALTEAVALLGLMMAFLLLYN